MRRLGSLIESLPTAAAKRRAATWIFQKYAEDLQGRHSEMTLRSAIPVTSVTQFIANAAPEFKSDRLLLLIEWSGLNGDPEPSTRDLNSLNREAGGDPFSEAASIGHPLVERGLLERPEQGHLRLTEAGLRAVNALHRRQRH